MSNWTHVAGIIRIDDFRVESLLQNGMTHINIQKSIFRLVQKDR